MCRHGCSILNSYITEILAILLLAGNARKDIREHQISLPLTLACFPPALICALMTRNDLPFGLVLSVIPGLISLTVTLFTGGQIGAGDGILICLLGILYPLTDVCTILSFALLFSAIYSGLLLLRRHRGKEEYAFVPFMLAGLAVYVLLGG